MSKSQRKAADRLAREIVAFMYETGMKKGDHYLSEADALKKHGVSRATLREAVRFLEMLGVLKVRAGPGGGTVVDEPGWDHLASSFALILQFARAPLREVLEARRVLEPGMAELAAANADPSDIKSMAAELDAMREGVGDYSIFSAAYRRFWQKLGESTHNAVLAFLSPALRAIVDSGGFVPNELYRASLLQRLEEIHGAVAAHDVALARSRMRALEDEFLERLTSGYPRQTERVIAWSEV